MACPTRRFKICFYCVAVLIRGFGRTASEFSKGAPNMEHGCTWSRVSGVAQGFHTSVFVEPKNPNIRIRGYEGRISGVTRGEYPGLRGANPVDSEI